MQAGQLCRGRALLSMPGLEEYKDRPDLPALPQSEAMQNLSQAEMLWI